MKKYRIIGREKNGGINSDEGLKALNGYGEAIYETDDDQQIEDVFEAAKIYLDQMYPNCRFATYELSELSKSPD